MLLQFSLDSEFEARAYRKHNVVTAYKHSFLACASIESLLFHG